VAALAAEVFLFVIFRLVLAPVFDVLSMLRQRIQPSRPLMCPDPYGFFAYVMVAR
jgi:hypothetical protein